MLTFSENILKLKILNQNYNADTNLNNDELYLKKELLPNQTIEQEIYCRLPRFNLIGHTNHESNPNCKMEHEWGYLKQNRWLFNQSVVNKFNSLFCKYRSIHRVDDHNNYYSKYMNLKDNQLILDEVIEVGCVALSGFLNTKLKFTNLYVQIVSKLKHEQSKTAQQNHVCKPMNIILLSYDSLSRVSWFKRLPKTTEYILNKMNFKLMYGQR